MNTPTDSSGPKLHPSIRENFGQPVPKDLYEEVRTITSRVRTKMTTDVPFFGHLLLKLEPVITRNVLLAGITRDRKLLINPDWAQNTTQAEYGATMVHEVLHAAMLFWDRQGGRDIIAVGGDGMPLSLWNIAHDYAINLIIRDMTRHTSDVLDPEKWEPAGLIDDKYRDWSAEEIYDDILKKAQQNSQKGQGGPGGQGPGGGRVSVPQADATKDDVKAGSEAGQGQDDSGPPDKLSSAEQKANDQFWKTAIVEAAMVHEQQSKQQGSLPRSVRKLIDEILDPRIPWTDVLSRWVGENGRRADFTYRRPSRRSDSIGEILPSLQRHGVDDIVVLWDTSGSMGGREKEILSETIGICEDLNMKLRVICCDTAIHSDQSDVGDPDDIDVIGGGGSNFRPAFALLDDEGYTGVVVAFTDGYISVPDTKPYHLRDCLWVIWNGDVDPTGGSWGEVLNVDEEGFAR